MEWAGKEGLAPALTSAVGSPLAEGVGQVSPRDAHQPVTSCSSTMLVVEPGAAESTEPRLQTLP